MSWCVWIDTGGTFTDCIALGPEGQVRRSKVLSSGVLRRRVLDCTASGALEIESAPELPPRFLVGLDVRLQGDASQAPMCVATQEPAGNGRLCIETREPWSAVPSKGDVLEFLTHREAPVVGVHLLFGSCFGGPLPEFDLRLGTTRGTNALLEGQGAPTAVFLTRGFGDLLEVGDQSRPDIFALEIVRNPVLARAVIEVVARRDPSGDVVCALEGSELGRVSTAAKKLRADGCEAAAVSLLHAGANDQDERRLEQVVREAGFEHVSAGADLSRLRGYLHRTQTAVVDAALAPIMRRYLDRVRDGVGRSFQVMSSGGGLVHVDRFRAKDSLLSGPAGGVIGCRHAASRADLLPALAFDMGGTSTDVSRVDDTLEYDEKHDVGGQVVHAAALAIRTVAAGGGSICRIEHEEAMVGPQSAGADPGPACYGAGGPLTLTDVNLLLGRIDASRFEVPLNVDAAEEACAAQLTLAPQLGRYELLEGFLEVANERMADTIRQVSTRRGFDPAEHTLVAFGGAGGQHACAIAELLGIRRVLVPADCSLLSAVGIGVARPELIVHEQISCDVESPRLASTLEAGVKESVRRLRERESLPAETRIRTETVVKMRYIGQDEGLEIEYSDDADLVTGFEVAYQELFGYRVDREIEVDWARHRVQVDEPAPDLRTQGARAETESRQGSNNDAGVRESLAWFDGTFGSIDCIERSSVPWQGSRPLPGPILVSEEFSSTWVPRGWAAIREPAAGGLVLERREA